jgi:4-amino-4-deoxy-L-arabinose transferase-like glycosyltransferase
MGVIPASYLINCLTLAASLIGLYALCRALGLEVTWPALVFYCLWAANYYLLRAVRPDAIPICMSLFTVVALIRYSQRQSLPALLAAAVACSVAATARYMALFTLLPVAAAAVWVFAARDWRLRMRHVPIFVAIACTPIGLWLLRNYRVTGYLSGMSRSAPRKWAADHTFIENIYLVLKAAALDAFSFLSRCRHRRACTVRRAGRGLVSARGSANSSDSTGSRTG